MYMCHNNGKKTGTNFVVLRTAKTKYSAKSLLHKTPAFNY